MRWIIALIGLLMALPAAGQGLTLTGAGTFAGGGGGGGSFTTWDSVTYAANWTFTNGNLTANCKVAFCSAGNQGIVASTNPVNPTTDTRKLYWEITPSVTGADSTFAVGFGTALCMSGGSGSGLNAGGCVGVYMNGDVAANGTLLPAFLPPYTTGTIIAFAYDFGGKLLWVKEGCAGLWNNSGTANPGTGTGGGAVDFSGTTPPLNTTLAMLDGFNGNANGGTLNAGATAFACTIPSGFVRWQ